MTGKQQLFPNCFESVVRCPSPPSRRRQLREILVQSTPLECTDRWSGMGRGEWGEAPCQDDFVSNPPPFPSGITEHWSPIVSIGFSFHRRSIPSLFLSSPPQQFLDTTRLLPDQDTREVGEHARKGKFPYLELSAVLGIYRNLPLPKSVQDGGVDTSIDRIRFTLIHSPPPCSRMFKYVIRLVNIQLRSRCYSRSLRIV